MRLSGIQYPRIGQGGRESERSGREQDTDQKTGKPSDLSRVPLKTVFPAGVVTTIFNILAFESLLSSHMMIYAHRAYLDGINPALENSPEAIFAALGEGFGVEIDLRQADGRWFLGHDIPTYPIDLHDFDRPGVIFHLKTPHVPVLHHADAFAMDHDRYSLTMRGRLWTNYGEPIGPQSIACAPELVKNPETLSSFARRSQEAFGVCTDFPRAFAALMKEE